ncbi:PAS domain S-box protein [Methanosphaerula subterraneus]|uniref:response regulator n=1 Tax=Methanosphaerula subterraneus TaxID=3350244 RepID=UPI003F833BC3
MIVYSLLYVDDEPGLLDIGRLFLEESGEFSVVTIDSASAALDLLRQEAFDAIISDYQMPEMDGIGLLKEVRSKDSDIPFILFTGRGREDVVIEAINCGVDFYVQKGGDIRAQFADLAHKIKRAIERRRVGEALAGNRNYLDQIFSSVLEGILIIDAETHQIIDLNPAAAGILGSTRDRILHQPCHQYICSDKADLCPVTDLHQSIENAEDMVLTARGERVAIMRNVVPFNYQGRTCLLETIVDNTARKKADEDLRTAYERIAAAERELQEQNDLLKISIEQLVQSEERFREFSDFLPVPACETDLTGTLTFYNRAVSAVFGYSSDECRQGITVIDLIQKDERQRGLEVLSQVLTGELSREGMEFTLQRKDGGTFPAIVYANTIKNQMNGACTGLRGVILDISKRKMAEQGLQESEEKFRSLVEQSLEGIIIVDLSGRLLYANPTFGEIIECEQYQDLVGRCRVLDFITETSRADAVQAFTQVAAGSDSFLISFKIHTLIMSERWVECIGKKISYRSAPAMLLSFRDVTVRRETEEALRESGELHSKLIATIPDIVVQTAIDGTVVAINDSVVTVGGYAGPEDLIGKNVFSFFAPEDLPRVAENARLMFERKLGPVEYHFFKGDGTQILLEVNGDVLRMPDGRPYGMVFICRDITERKQVEVALQQANRKLRLLSGVTRHDINNQMMVLMGHLGILQEDWADTTQDASLQKVTAAAERISAMIRFTGEYEEIGITAPTWQKIRAVIRRAGREAPLGDLGLTIDLPDSAEVLADPLIVKVFYNLMENAARFGEEATMIEFSVLDRDGNLVVVCEDDGDGIRPEEKEKIFRRGFGENTGLGLFLAREILSITGIAIHEIGESGKGARFEIVIPRGMYRMQGDAGPHHR